MIKYYQYMPCTRDKVRQAYRACALGLRSVYLDTLSQKEGSLAACSISRPIKAQMATPHPEDSLTDSEASTSTGKQKQRSHTKKRRSHGKMAKAGHMAIRRKLSHSYGLAALPLYPCLEPTYAPNKSPHHVPAC